MKLLTRKGLVRGVLVLGVAALLAVLLLATAACGSRGPAAIVPEEQTLRYANVFAGRETVRYELVEIEGMPCLVCHGYMKFAVTCDWSQWDGSY